MTTETHEQHAYRGLPDWARARTIWLGWPPPADWSAVASRRARRAVPSACSRADVGSRRPTSLT